MKTNVRETGMVINHNSKTCTIYTTEENIAKDLSGIGFKTKKNSTNGQYKFIGEIPRIQFFKKHFSLIAKNEPKNVK